MTKEQKMQKQIFKVLDRVFDIRFGWGEVVGVNKSNMIFPVLVKFKNKIECTYTSNGCDGANILPILSFTEYTLQGFSQERPIDYKDYTGKWGKFYDDDMVGFIISKLYKLNEGNEFGFVEKDGYNCYTHFEPLTDEQIKILGLE